MASYYDMLMNGRGTVPGGLPGNGGSYGGGGYGGGFSRPEPWERPVVGGNPPVGGSGWGSYERPPVGGYGGYALQGGYGGDSRWGHLPYGGGGGGGVGPTGGGAPDPAVSNAAVTPPPAFDFSASGADARNPFINRLMSPGNTFANQAVRDPASTFLGRQADTYEHEGAPMVSSLTGQVTKNLDEQRLQDNMRRQAEENAARATAAQKRSASEAGMSAAEQSAVAGQGAQNMQSARRQAEMDAEQISAARRAEAGNLGMMLRSPAEKFGAAQIGSGAAQQAQGFAGQQGMLNRLTNIGEAEAGREYAGGQAEAGRRVAGIGMALPYVDPYTGGAFAGALGSGAGIGLTPEQLEGQRRYADSIRANIDAGTGLMNRWDPYMDRLMQAGDNGGGDGGSPSNIYSGVYGGSGAVDQPVIGNSDKGYYTANGSKLSESETYIGRDGKRYDVKTGQPVIER